MRLPFCRPVSRRSSAFLFCALLLSLASVVLLHGCGDPTPFDSGSHPIPGLPTSTFSGTVVLPTGVKVSETDTAVQDSVQQVHPDHDGKFQLDTYDLGSQVGMVLSRKGNPMMMGFLDANHTTIDVNSTAEVYAYYALGGPLMLAEADRQALIAAIHNQGATLQAFGASIGTELVASPESFAAPDAKLTEALSTYLEATLGPVPSGSSAAIRQVLAGAQHHQGILIQGGQQSGIDVIQDPPSSANIQNSFRRRAYAFVDRVSDTTGGVTTSDPGHITDFEVAPTDGLNGGVTGAITSIFNTYYGNQATSYAPTTSSDFGVPLTKGADKTSYLVTIVGPGHGHQELVPQLTSAQNTQRIQTVIGGFVQDAVVPFFANAVFGSGFSNGGAQPVYSQFRADLISNFQTDLLSFTATAPAIQQELLDGNYKGAFQDLFVTGAASNTLRTIFVQAANTAVLKSVAGSSSFVPGALSNAASHFNIILNAAGGVLQVFDTTVYGVQLLQSDAVDQWTIDVTGTTVKLSPATASIPQTNGSQGLAVTLPGVDTTGYSYQWTVAGSVGTLSETGGGGRTGQTSYCSSSAQASYIPNPTPKLTANAQDTVTVKAFSAGNCTQANLLGSASSVITVTPVTIDYTLYGGPGAVNCTPNAPAPSTLFVNDDLYVYLNGKLNFTHIGATCDMGPIPLTGAKKGDVVELKVYDTYGSGTGLSALYMNDGTGKYVMVDPGFYNPDTPPGDNGLQYDHSFTIPF